MQMTFVLTYYDTIFKNCEFQKARHVGLKQQDEPITFWSSLIPSEHLYQIFRNIIKSKMCFVRSVTFDH